MASVERNESGYVVPQMIDALERLPEHVRAERLRRGLSLRAAAGEIGYPFADLCRFEQGKRVPTLTSVLSMLRWLAVGDGA